MSYRAPVADMVFTLRHVAGLDGAIADGLYGDLTPELVEAILEEGGRFADDAHRAAQPRRRPSRRRPSRTARSTTPPGLKDAYRGLGGRPAGTRCPARRTTAARACRSRSTPACIEMWNAAALAFALCPLLTVGAHRGADAHGTEELKARYLAKLVSGEWTGDDEPDRAAGGLRPRRAAQPRAEPAGDGSYRITGQKIFITYGEHDLTDNIVHLVLARLPDAPPGTRGISLFLVPKFLVRDGAEPRNDLRCVSIEHKLGIHASPTCVMAYGDEGGATGWLIGEENQRPGVHVHDDEQRPAQCRRCRASRSPSGPTQQALAYARERVPGPRAEAPATATARSSTSRTCGACCCG